MSINNKILYFKRKSKFFLLYIYMYIKKKFNYKKCIIIFINIINNYINKNFNKKYLYIKD